MNQSQASKINDIEALRAIAVLLTIVDHLAFLFPWGNDTVYKIDTYFGFWTGVDLFFAISGFVIARDLLVRLERAGSGEPFWRITFAFWIRRVYRIWPTSYLWLIVIVLCSVIFRHAGYFQPLRQQLADFAAIAMQVANFHFLWCVKNHQFDPCGSAGAWWSLSLEEQFYLALPFAVLMFRKKLPYALAVLVLVQIFIPRGVWTTFNVVRTDAIALGVLLALFARHRNYEILKPAFMDKRRYAIPVVVLLLFLLVELPSTGTGKINPVPFSTGLVAIVSVVLVFIASYNNDYIVRNPLAKRILLWMGSRSYGLYLIHMVALYLTQTIWWYASPRGTVFGPNYSLRYLVTWIPLTLILTELNYRLLETPLRRKGKRLSTQMEAFRINPQSTPSPRHAEISTQQAEVVDARSGL